MPGEKSTHASVMSADLEVLAGVYAQALLDHLAVPAAAEAQAGAEIDAEIRSCADELDGLVTVLDETPGVDDLLTMPMSVTARCDLAERIFQGRLSDATYALLAVMARRGRLMLIRAVAREFRSLLDTRGGKVEVTVTTAAELAPTQRDQLVLDIERKFGAKPILTERVNPAIIGGAIVQVGDMAYDTSLASSLARFGRQLTDRVAAMTDKAL